MLSAPEVSRSRLAVLLWWHGLWGFWRPGNGITLVLRNSCIGTMVQCCFCDTSLGVDFKPNSAAFLYIELLLLVKYISVLVMFDISGFYRISFSDPGLAERDWGSAPGIQWHCGIYVSHCPESNGCSAAAERSSDPKASTQAPFSSTIPLQGLLCRRHDHAPQEVRACILLFAHWVARVRIYWKEYHLQQCIGQWTKIVGHHLPFCRGMQTVKFRIKSKSVE